MSTALILIDIQHDFMPGGALAVPEGDLILPRLHALANASQTLVMTQDWHPEGHVSFASTHGLPVFSSVLTADGDQTLWPDHCVAGSLGAGITDIDLEDAADMILRKGFSVGTDSYSAFFENDRKTSTGLSGWLMDRGISDLTIAGLAYDYCVAWSALDAAGLGYRVTVDRAGCRAISKETEDAMTAKMIAAGVMIV